MIPGCPDIGEYRDARGRTPVDPEIFKQPHSLILASAGQSMLGNFGQFSYVPWTGGVFELCTVTGNIYQVSSDAGYPCMGMDGWFHGEVPGPIRRSVLHMWGDYLVAIGRAQRVLLAGHNVGGTWASRWCPVGDLFPRSEAVFRHLNSLGIPPNFWIDMLGQGDLTPSTPPVTYQGVGLGVAVDAANWSALMRWRWHALKSIGMNAPIVLGQGAHHTNVSNVYPDRYAMVKAGQRAAALDEPGLGISLGPDDDEWPDSYRVDGVHPGELMAGCQLQRWVPCFPTF
jgi:hypothetical protein